MKHAPEGNYEENNEGDVVVPDAPDSRGWQKEKQFDHEYFLEKPELSFDPMVHAAKNLVGEVVRVDVEEDLEVEEVVSEKDLQERLFEVRERFGFIPHSSKELNDVVSLTGRDFVQGAATFLNTVLRRQQNVLKDYAEINEQVENGELPLEKKKEIDEDMPRKSVMEIAGRYRAYAGDAGKQRALLLQFTTMINRRGTKRSEPALATPIVAAWSSDGSTRAPVKGILRSRKINEFVETGIAPKEVFDTDKLASKDIDALGSEYLSAIKTGQLQNEIAFNAQQHQNRLDFWAARLEEATTHNAAKPVAVKALDDLRSAGLL